MRVGIIADVHGNLVALETVLAEMEREPVDLLLCLGDVAALGPQPGEVVTRLREAGCPSVLGNTDAWLLREPPRTTGPAGEAMSGISRWCTERLSDKDLAYLRACPPTMRVSLGEEDAGMLCFHGSPRSHDEVVSATTPDGALSEMLSGHRASVFAGGHTHVQLLRCHGDARVINPGSVGLPGVGPGTPDLPVNGRVRWAEYAVLEAEGGRLDVDLRRVPVDLGRALEAARASGMPHLDWWAGRWDDTRRDGPMTYDRGEPRARRVVASFSPHTLLSGEGSTGRRKRRRVGPTDDREQLELPCYWEERREYERIVLLVLFGEPMPERAHPCVGQQIAPPAFPDPGHRQP